MGSGDLEKLQLCRWSVLAELARQAQGNVFVAVGLAQGLASAELQTLGGLANFRAARSRQA